MCQMKTGRINSFEYDLLYLSYMYYMAIKTHSLSLSLSLSSSTFIYPFMELSYTLGKIIGTTPLLPMLSRWRTLLYKYWFTLRWEINENKWDTYIQQIYHIICSNRQPLYLVRARYLYMRNIQRTWHSHGLQLSHWIGIVKAQFVGFSIR